MKKWLGVDIKSDWLPQSDITFSFIWEGKAYTDKGKVIRFEKPKTLAYYYWSGFSGLSDKLENYSKVEFNLQPVDEGTILKLTHSGFPTETMYKHSDKNWEETLDVIQRLSEPGGL